MQYAPIIYDLSPTTRDRLCQQLQTQIGTFTSSDNLQLLMLWANVKDKPACMDGLEVGDIDDQQAEQLRDVLSKHVPLFEGKQLGTTDLISGTESRIRRCTENVGCKLDSSVNITLEFSCSTGEKEGW